MFLPTILLRHRKENRKKCSLTPLEGKEEFLFLRYPQDIEQQKLPPLSSYTVLQVGEKPLSEEDSSDGLFLIDATWRYSEKILSQLPPMKKRGIPMVFTTAYPRKQTGCSHPDLGLASIEALFIAFLITKRPIRGLLEHYFWKNEFLQKNRATLKPYLSLQQESLLYNNWSK